jgi:methionyl-tRNA formyltransferase
MSVSFAFFGTPGFCNCALDVLLAAYRAPIAIVCQPDRPRGRGRKLSSAPSKSWAHEHNIPVIQPASCKEPGFQKSFSELNPDLGVVFAFGQLLPESLLAIPRLGFINVHPSLLPRYRGAAPIQWAIINGDKETGVSIVEVTPRLDDGDIILQQKTIISPDETAVELGERLAELGGALLVTVLGLLDKGKVEAKPQEEGKATWAPALRKQDGRIDWSRPAGKIHDLVRGVQPWPGAQTSLRGKALKLHRTSLATLECRVQPGDVQQASGSDILVGTGDGGLLRLEELQLEGKKRISAKAFISGRQIKVGDRLE